MNGGYIFGDFSNPVLPLDILAHIPVRCNGNKKDKHGHESISYIPCTEPRPLAILVSDGVKLTVSIIQKPYIYSIMCNQQATHIT